MEVSIMEDVMKTSYLNGSLRGQRPWFWTVVVADGEEVYHVTQDSQMAAYGEYGREYNFEQAIQSVRKFKNGENFGMRVSKVS